MVGIVNCALTRLGLPYKQIVARTLQMPILTYLAISYPSIVRATNALIRSEHSHFSSIVHRRDTLMLTA
jgi:hypothetical protein